MGPFTIFVILFALVLFISFFYCTEVLSNLMERLLAPSASDSPNQESVDDISQAKNIRRIRDDLEDTAKSTKNMIKNPDSEFEDDELLLREDNADEESIRPYLPPIVEAKANSNSVPATSAPRKEVSLTIENAICDGASHFLNTVLHKEHRMTVFLILTAIAYGIFKTGCFILLVLAREPAHRCCMTGLS